MVIFYVYMRKRAKKSPFYVAYTRKTVCEVFSFACDGFLCEGFLSAYMLRKMVISSPARAYT